MARYRPKSRTKDSQGEMPERRKTRRVACSEIPSLKSARLFAGQDVKLINLSPGGALLESTTRILPGARICIRLVAADALFLLRGQVLRSRASSLGESGLTYQCSVAFDEEFTLLSDRRDQPLPRPEIPEMDPIERAAEAGQTFPAVINEESPTSMTLTVPIQRSGCDLRNIFGH